MSDRPAPAASLLSDLEFDERTGRILSRLEATLDDWLQDDVVDIDTQRTGGLMELRFPNRSVIVINTQPPLHELWLAAQAGGYHFRFDGQHWVEREGLRFEDVLSARATEQAGQPLRFEI